MDDLTQFVPGDAPLWWAALALVLLLGTQLVKWLVTRSGKPAWWSRWHPRLFTLVSGAATALVLLPLPGGWLLEGLQGLVAGLVAILAYDAVTDSDAAIGRAGWLFLVAGLAGALAWPLAGCSGLPEASVVTWEGVSATGHVEVDGDGQVEGGAEIVTQWTLWGAPVEVRLHYLRGMAGGCLVYQPLPPLCFKHDLAGGG